jgi:hypothetical protein
VEVEPRAPEDTATSSGERLSRSGEVVSGEYGGNTEEYGASGVAVRSGAIGKSADEGQCKHKRS